MQNVAFKEVTCCACGWVHFAVNRADAEKEVARFNAYFATLSEQKQQDYYGGQRSSIVSYEHCRCCGGSYKNFRLSAPGDAPDGVTMNPVIDFTDDSPLA